MVLKPANSSSDGRTTGYVIICCLSPRGIFVPFDPATINANLEQQAQAYFQELFVDNADPEFWKTLSRLLRVWHPGQHSKKYLAALWKKSRRLFLTLKLLPNSATFAPLSLHSNAFWKSRINRLRYWEIICCRSSCPARSTSPTFSSKPLNFRLAVRLQSTSYQ